MGRADPDVEPARTWERRPHQQVIRRQGSLTDKLRIFSCPASPKGLRGVFSFPPTIDADIRWVSHIGWSNSMELAGELLVVIIVIVMLATMIIPIIAGETKRKVRKWNR